MAIALNSRNHAPTGPYASLKRTGMKRTSWHVISAPPYSVKKALAPELKGGYQERPKPSPVERGLKTCTAPPIETSVALALKT